MYNRYLFGNTVRNTKHPFKLPTNFTAPIPDNSNLQEYISNVYYDIKTADYHMTMKRPPTNITKHEIQSLHLLKTDNDLIVKPADKGGAIVIWPKDSFLKEAYRQLNDSNHYRKIPHDPTPEILTETKKLAYNLYKSKIIDNTTYKFLTTDTRARTPHLYLLPKIHKQEIPGRPITRVVEALQQDYLNLQTTSSNHCLIIFQHIYRTQHTSSGEFSHLITIYQKTSY